MSGKNQPTDSQKAVFKRAKEAAAKYGLKVRAEQKMSDIIDSQVLPSDLSRPDRDSFKQASFDVVIVGAVDKALLVIEFDGPEHLRPKNQEADYRKGLFCSMVGL